MKKPRLDPVWPFLIILTLFTASGQSQLAAPSFSFSPDKIAHFMVFGALATSVIRLDRFRTSGWTGALWVWFWIALYGGLDEYRQSFTPGRSVEFDDWLADALGAAVAVVLYQGWPAYRRVLESRPMDGLGEA